ncbi:MBL fold metallo-hydrolase [Propionicicella superfundia]|uniref:MBL fold metallo-hydrolase n=1 Tax=Propionicicella superfundia TaxID=348582 RepID=UPI0004183922|nr:MBL fold metallo-hydrolase [Propionicicella superfundia]
MFITSFASGQWQSNCYLVAGSAAPGTDCVIVDPGWGADEMARRLVERHRLRPVAILLTHGHLDHIGAAHGLAAEYEIETWIHPADRRLLREPGAGLPPDWAPMLRALAGSETLPEPWLVRELDDLMELDLGGLGLRIRHAPGHTGGSVLALCDYPDDPEVSAVMFSGDVLFAGSIGRTDLPGSDHDAMRRSLEVQILSLPDDVVALPGHGAQTSIGYERVTNPYLQSDYWRNQS